MPVTSTVIPYNIPKAKYKYQALEYLDPFSTRAVNMNTYDFENLLLCN